MINLPKPSLGQLTDNQVHIWHVPLAALTAYTSHLLPLLSAKEQESYQRACQFQKHPPQLASRALLRLLLSHYIPTKAQDIAMIEGEHGKPSLQDYPWLQYSTSHTKTDIVFAITCHDRLGIDIETLRPTKDYLDLAKRFFSPTEYAYLSTLSEQDGKQAFIKLWTVKEAFVKAVGFGLSYPLSDFTVVFTDEKPIIHDKAQIKESSQASDWQCYTWSFDGDTDVSLVIESKSKQLLFGTLNIELL